MSDPFQPRREERLTGDQDADRRSQVRLAQRVLEHRQLLRDFSHRSADVEHAMSWLSSELQCEFSSGCSHGDILSASSLSRLVSCLPFLGSLRLTQWICVQRLSSYLAGDATRMIPAPPTVRFFVPAVVVKL